LSISRTRCGGLPEEYEKSFFSVAMLNKQHGLGTLNEVEIRGSMQWQQRRVYTLHCAAA